MTTRDIKLEEVILDLLDNCGDGILRSGSRKGKKPYTGFKAEIEFSADSFSTRDTETALDQYAAFHRNSPYILRGVP